MGINRNIVYTSISSQQCGKIEFRDRLMILLHLLNNDPYARLTDLFYVVFLLKQLMHAICF